MRELRIRLINPINSKGVYDPKSAESIDEISVALYTNGLLFIKVLLDEIINLLSRNGLYPED